MSIYDKSYDKINNSASWKRRKKLLLFKKRIVGAPAIDYSINDDMCDLDIPAFLQDSYIKGNPPPSIISLRSWQRGLLSREEWKNNMNCVSVAPTSGGKTLIAEVAIAQLLDGDPLAKAIYTLPFVALAAEKNNDLQQRFTRYIVRPFYQNIGGSDFSRGSIAICTYEKAHSLLNSAIKNLYVSKIKLVIIDEIHMIGDQSRGVVAESLIMKLMLLTHSPRIVALTATLNQSDAIHLAQRIHGFCHFSTIRTSEIKQFLSLSTDGSLYRLKNGELMKILTAKSIKEDTSCLLPMVRAVIHRSTGAAVLIFVNTRQETKKIALFLAKHINISIEGIIPYPQPTETIINLRNELIHALLKGFICADESLQYCIKQGIGFHHAGLLLEERKIVENGIKNGSLSIVVATTTLSAGVNIRNVSRVVIHSPYRKFYNKKELISPALFAQMSGRSGRVEGAAGDVVVIARSNHELEELKNMMIKPLPNIESSLMKTSQIHSYILQTLSLGLATDIYSLKTFLSTSFEKKEEAEFDNLIKESLEILGSYDLIQNFQTKTLGNAITASNLSIEEGIELNRIIDKMMNSLCLLDDLHLLFLCSPQQTGIYMPSFQEPIWENIFEVHSHVIFLITDKSINELRRIIVFSFNGKLQMSAEDSIIFERIYTACILGCLIDESSIVEIEKKYNVDRGTIQSLQMNAASYAGQATRFTDAMGFYPLAAALQQFRKRLNFGVKSELVELMRIPSLRRDIARKLYQSDIKDPAELVALTVDQIANKISANPEDDDIHYLAKRILNEAKSLTENMAIIEEYEEKAALNAQIFVGN